MRLPEATGLRFLILTKPDCHWCSKAKELITRLGHTYTEYDLTQKLEIRDMCRDLGFKTVPQVFLAGMYPMHIGGYNDLELVIGDLNDERSD